MFWGLTIQDKDDTVVGVYINTMKTYFVFNLQLFFYSISIWILIGIKI